MTTAQGILKAAPTMPLSRTEDLRLLITLALYTGRIEGVRPLSLLIIAPIGAGKTESVAEFSELPTVLYANSITPSALYRHYGRALFEGRYHHIIVPDFSSVMGRGREERAPILLFFNALVEEGVVRVLSMFTRLSPETLGVAVKGPVRCGLITCISTPDYARSVASIHGKRSVGETVGFFSRMLPVSYRYSQDSVKDILSALAEGAHNRGSHTTLLALPVKQTVMRAAHYGPVLDRWAADLKDVTDTYGFRRWKQLESLLMASALYDKRNEVSGADIIRIRKLLPFINDAAEKEL